MIPFVFLYVFEVGQKIPKDLILVPDDCTVPAASVIEVEYGVPGVTKVRGHVLLPIRAAVRFRHLFVRHLPQLVRRADPVRPPNINEEERVQDDEANDEQDQRQRETDKRVAAGKGYALSACIHLVKFKKKLAAALHAERYEQGEGAGKVGERERVDIPRAAE